MMGTPTAVDPAFMQFGSKDGTDYVYVAGGSRPARRPHRPIEGSDAYDMMLWYGVGYSNPETCGEPPAFDGCSYGVTQLHADSSAGQLEMAVAGIGVGFCGVQLTSDQTTIYGEGSADMGESCNEPRHALRRRHLPRDSRQLRARAVLHPRRGRSPGGHRLPRLRRQRLPGRPQHPPRRHRHRQPPLRPGEPDRGRRRLRDPRSLRNPPGVTSAKVSGDGALER